RCWHDDGRDDELLWMLCRVAQDRGPPMSNEQTTSSGTVRTLRALIVAALVIPALLWGVAAWRDRLAILENARADTLKLMEVFKAQAVALFEGHDILLDLLVQRIGDRDWNEIEATPGILSELEAMDKRLDDASAILLVDANGRTRSTTVHVLANEPLPA